MWKIQLIQLIHPHEILWNLQSAESWCGLSNMNVSVHRSTAHSTTQVILYVEITMAKHSSTTAAILKIHLEVVCIEIGHSFIFTTR